MAEQAAFEQVAEEVEGASEALFVGEPEPHGQRRPRRTGPRLDLYGFTWGRNITGGASAAVDRSFDRYLRHVTDSSGADPLTR